MHAIELRLPPVAQALLVALAMWSAARLFPALKFTLPGARWLAIIFLLAGALIGVLGVAEFRRAQTTVDPRVPHKTSTLVVTGIYQVSRNPMYVGLLLILAAWAFYLGHLLALFMLPLFVVFMNRLQIAPEERYMLEKFGDEYRRYHSRVRRWF